MFAFFTQCIIGLCILQFYNCTDITGKQLTNSRLMLSFDNEDGTDLLWFFFGRIVYHRVTAHHTA